jgi:phosphoglucosamine mutase
MYLFGTSGIRRIVGKELFQLAFKVGLAVGGIYHSVVVGSDTRTSSSALKHTLISGVLAGGGGCFDVGVLPTPTLALAARGFRAGVMITASHNPPQYNGIKLLNPDGSAFDAAQCAQIEELVLGDLAAAAPWNSIKESGLLSGALEEHIRRIQRDFPEGLRLKVVVDGGCGAAYQITPDLFGRLGCRVVTMNCYPSGFFPRVAEPTEQSLKELARAVGRHRADLGIAHDGDADRMMAVDERGRFIPGDKLLILFARELGAGEVVTTVDASMSIEEMGFRVTRTRVGDTYVSRALGDGGDFGGEPSGSWVFPGISLCPDGIYAAARLGAIASRERLSRLLDEIPSYPMLRGSVSGSGLVMEELASRLEAMKPLSVSTLDGLKLTFDDGWLLVRPSGTEPKVRVTVEARDEKRGKRLYDKAIALIEGCLVGEGAVA